VKRLATTECRATAALVRSLVELDARRLYLGEAYSSRCSRFSVFTKKTRSAETADKWIDWDRELSRVLRDRRTLERALYGERDLR
jgi:hypothetical protein